jgi:LysM repeat protein
MNTPNPLIPQGALQSNQGKGRSTVKLAVVSIVAVHVVFFGGLLLQGCKRENKTADNTGLSSTLTNLTLPPDTNTSPYPYYTNATNLPSAEPVATNVTPPAGNNVVSTPEPPVNNGVVPQAPAGEAKEYTVARGDSLYKIAKANGVTVGAITKANPKLDAARLKVGQKIMIPAPAAGGGNIAAAPGGAGIGGGGATAEGGTGTHVVKGGETLTKIAKQHGTTIKAIRAANGLKTDRLTVGQKLKIPLGKGTEAAKGPGTANGVTNQ